jgi:hypothetical protein
MHDVRVETHAPAAFERRASQYQEAPVFVRIERIQAAAGIQRLGFHQIHRCRRAGQVRSPDIDEVLVPPDDDGHALQRLEAGGVETLAPDLRIERHEQADVMARGGELAGQRPGHVGETAGLGQRHDLGGDGADGEFHSCAHSSVGILWVECDW